ncbi:hypothetical protein BpHYR1_049896 [Brachionus plicatilis]|uniref:Uncharacterized protein n=2 Tax=Brachionus plicatilis TaxID=10195 RepID=A0A3M7QEY5_BRAPC|nr:hypothetical protein BpHYR1_049896 [Brachionus plicatilis]
MEENFIDTGSTLQRTPQNNRPQTVCMISETSKRPRSKLSPEQSPLENRFVETSEFTNLKNRVILLEDLEWIIKSKDTTIQELTAKVENLTKRLEKLESIDAEKLQDIEKLKEEVKEAKLTSKTTDISKSWVQAVGRRTKHSKKPVEQMVVENATINEFNEREKRKKNIIIYGIPESQKNILSEKKADDG